MGSDFKRPELTAFTYHRDLAAHLRASEPEIWAWTASNHAQAQHVEDMRAAVLRQTYRLESEAHPDIHQACQEAMAALAIDAPFTLYQAADGAMNAALCFIPGEVHLIFHGPILERLSPRERLALMGHELAHYRLWSQDDGELHVANRILDHALAYPSVAPAHVETARLFRLYTELYADRGGALAAHDAEPAISTLIKVMTGLPTVDPAAYLRQAAELVEDAGKSQGQTHPEIFLRAQALHKWWAGDEDLEGWLDRRVRGPFSVTALDLLRQKELVGLTRAFFAHFLADPALRSDEILTQVRRFFPDWGQDEDPTPVRALLADGLDDSTRDYLIALMFDCAMADPDAKAQALSAAARIAEDFGGSERLRVALRRDLKYSKAQIDKVLKPAGRAA